MTHVEVEVGVFESYTLLLSAIGAIEFGATYASIVCLLIITVAHSEMVRLQHNKAKEEKIVIKTRIIEWYLFFVSCFVLLPKFWLTQPLLAKSGLAPEPGSFLALALFDYHNIAVFTLMMGALVMFVVSLQEGFYAYQFKMLSWTLVSALLFVTGFTGMVSCLFKCRIWYFFAITCVTVHNAADFIACHYFPVKTRMLSLKPDATVEGFIAGAAACFLYFTIVSRAALS